MKWVGFFLFLAAVAVVLWRYDVLQSMGSILKVCMHWMR
jgi:hypothetical protein